MAYFFSWIIFVPLALNKLEVIFLFPHDEAHAREIDLWHSFGGIGPILSAILAVRLFDGKRGFSNFFKQYSLKKITFAGWFLSLFPVFLFMIAVLFSRIVEGRWIDLFAFFRDNKLCSPLNFFMWFLPILTYGFGEEGGWRGFVLPHLQSKYNALTATFILWFFWLGWHIPTFFYRYQLSGMMLIGFIFGLFAGAVLLTFTYNCTRGSLLAVSLWHFTFNFVSMIGNQVMMAATMSSLVIASAVFVLIKYGRKNLSPFPKTSVAWEDAR